MQFEFSATPRIIFGPGTVNTIGELSNEFEKRVTIIFNGPESFTNKIVNLLDNREIACQVIKVEQEPNIDLINNFVKLVRRFSPHFLIGIGGGSAIDTSKVLAALLTNPGEILDYLEVVGLNKPLTTPSLPLIAIPTTAGTGSEVTRNAVLDIPKKKVKVSIRSPYLVPRIAIIDPDLTQTLPPLITAYTGLDALTQLIEPYTCNLPNPMTDALCIQGIKLVAQSLYQVYNNGNDIQAREDMSAASFFSGFALANARLGAVHGFAGPLGGELSAPHGAIVSALLPNAMEVNVSALYEQSTDHPTLDRYRSIAKILTGDHNATIESGIKWIRDFCTHAKLLPLSSYGLTPDKFETILTLATKASSMKGNPITLSKNKLRIILERSM
jgi:alcohol dehydrogenase class IV